MTAVLNIFLQDQLIGYLTHLGGEQTVFSFSEEYLSAKSPQILGQS